MKSELEFRQLESAKRVSLLFFVLASVAAIVASVWLLAPRFFVEIAPPATSFLVTSGLACFCLGLGCAYYFFARYRDRQAEALAADYKALVAKGDKLVAEIKLAAVMKETGEESSIGTEFMSRLEPL
jgi:hypothetical protein